MTVRNRVAGLCSTFLAAIATCGTGAAQPYPNRPIEVVVPYPPGGNSDGSVRLFADRWSEFLGQPVVVVNRPGGGSSVGARFVANARPDGYTLLVGSESSFLTVRLTQPTAGYDLDSFTYLFGYGYGAAYFVLREDAPYRTVQDFIAAARQQPGTLTYASYGLGTFGQFAAELLWSRSGSQLTYVPFRSSPEANTALMGRHVNMSVPASTFGLGSGSGLRLAATTAPARLAFAPQVPTLRELGYEADLTYTIAIVGPAGLPPEVVQRLTEAHRLAYAKYREEIEHRLKALELVPVDIGGPALLRQLRERDALFRSLAPGMGLNPQ